MATVFFIAFFCFVLLMADFIPSQEFIKFTDYIIKLSLNNDSFALNLFPLLIELFLPFDDSAACIENLKIDYSGDTHPFKNYSKYFRSLITYYKLLKNKYQIQDATVHMIQELVQVASQTSNATPFENASGTPIDNNNLKIKTDLITHIQEQHTLIEQLDTQISKALVEFNDASIFCSDLHSFFNGTSSTSKNVFISNCSNNMNDDEVFIDITSLADDPPDILIKKFILIICKSYGQQPIFNKVKFWVISQLFIRL